MKIFFLASITSLVLLTSCNSPKKKILVLFKGKTEVNANTKTIEIKDGAGSAERELNYGGGEKVVLSLINKGATSTIDVPQTGSYIFNARPDTIVGSFQDYGELRNTTDVITQDMILNSIDSLRLLVEGKNVTQKNRNYFILPFSLAKITNNDKAFIVAPFHQISTLEAIDDKKPEVYKFWTVTEIREKIKKQLDLTDGKQIKPNK